MRNDVLNYLFSGIDVPKEDVEECGFEEFCFEAYSLLGALFRPKRVLEIGTRRGYSLLSLCKDNDDIEYVVSCDNESYIEGSQKIAFANLTKSGYKKESKFFHCASTADNFVEFMRDVDPFDYIHVDAGHDYPDVVFDLNLCFPKLAKDGIMVVHDTTYILDVRKATLDFVKKEDCNMIEIPMYRGAIILQRKGGL